MSTAPERILVFHTAFIGDILLMLPMVQILRRQFPDSAITVITRPDIAELVRAHPAVTDVVPYDKRGRHRGAGGMCALSRQLRGRRFDLAIVPHRSLRSALVVVMGRIPRRIGFSNSAGALLFTDRVRTHAGDHEIDRDIRLLEPVIGFTPGRELPVLGIPDADVAAAASILSAAEQRHPGFTRRPVIALAPGSVWRTKRWPAESYGALAGMLARDGCSVILLGGVRDRSLCEEVIRTAAHHDAILNAAGTTSLAGSGALLRRSRVLVSNDSAPAHMALGVGTPVIALFGPTVPAIGFAPVGPHDRLVEVAGLPCRPCNIHGSDECPIGSFECMRGISVVRVLSAVHAIISGQRAG
jgi:heptosyltransferase-2